MFKIGNPTTANLFSRLLSHVDIFQADEKWEIGNKPDQPGWHENWNHLVGIFSTHCKGECILRFCLIWFWISFHSKNFKVVWNFFTLVDYWVFIFQLRWHHRVLRVETKVESAFLGVKRKFLELKFAVVWASCSNWRSDIYFFAIEMCIFMCISNVHGKRWHLCLNI